MPTSFTNRLVTSETAFASQRIFRLSQLRTKTCCVSSDLARAARSGNPDRFCACEFTNACGAQFATKTGAFYAAEWQTRIGGNHRVDENHSAVQLRRKKFLLLAIFGPCARTQAECGVVRELEGRVGIADAENSCNRAEDFFAVRGRLFSGPDRPGLAGFVPSQVDRAQSPDPLGRQPRARACAQRIVEGSARKF